MLLRIAEALGQRLEVFFVPETNRTMKRILSVALLGMGALVMHACAAVWWGSRTIEHAFGNPDAADIIWSCASGSSEAKQFAQKLPPLSDVECEWLRPDGACCLAHFEDDRVLEVHLFPKRSNDELDLRTDCRPHASPALSRQELGVD